MGNRVETTRRIVSTAPAETITYQYDDANRLTSVNGQAYTWDNNGNLLSDGVRSYTYDHANRLTQVVSGTLTTEFVYNGAGDRVARTVDGVTTDYVLDPAGGLTQVLQETTGGQTTSYLYGHDLLAQYDSGTWAYHVNDGLGSVRQLADPMGQVVGSHSFSPFGVPLGESGGEPYGYTGEQWDASAGLVYLRARYYSPEVGRFVSKDPFPGSAHVPQSFNQWVYVQNNPILAVDPSGYLSNLTIAKAFFGPNATSDDFAGVLAMFEGNERWGFLKLLQDAKVGDTIDLAILVPNRGINDSVIESCSIACRRGQVMLSNQHDLTLADVMRDIDRGAYHHPREFNTWWRENQYWYYLNGHGPDPQTRAYVDWRETTDTPDFAVVGLEMGGWFVGTGPARIIDRYGNDYLSWSATIGIGAPLDITYMEGYAGLLGRDPDQILSESELRDIIEKWDVGVSGHLLLWGVGWSASYGGASVTFTGFGLGGLSGGVSRTWWIGKDSDLAWDWLDRIGFTHSDIRKDDSGVDDCGECQS